MSGQRCWLRSSALLLPPVLSALYPLVFIVRSHSETHLITWGMMLRPAAGLVASALLFVAVLSIVMGTIRRASVATTLFFVLVGLFPVLMLGVADRGWIVGLAFSFVSIAVAVLGSRVLDGGAGLIFSSTVGVVIAWTAASTLLVLTGVWPRPAWHGAVNSMLDASEAVQLPPTGGRPDVYYIVLDGMARMDVLEHLYGLDTGAEIRELRKMGVHVPAAARSNYSQTQLSLASALQMRYLDDLATVLGASPDRRPINRLIVGGGAPALLKRHGYEIIAIGPPTTISSEHADVDRCFCELPDGPTELEYTLLAITPFRGRHLDRAGMNAHRLQVRDSFDRVESVQSNRPMFVITHIVAPHPPFVFSADGQDAFNQEFFSYYDGDGFLGSRESYIAGYRDQARFVLRRVVTLMRRLIARSPRAIIVLHSDHGSGLRLVNADLARTDPWERLAIFSAYYDGERHAPVDDDISPVNALRWALRTGLSADLPALPNRSFVSDYMHPYRWREVPPQLPGAARQ